MSYDHKKIEKKWQEDWEEKKIYKAEKSNADKFFALIEFPYPSGAGLHVGHPRSFTAMDILSRKRRMQGYNVLFPIGWDAFGLPTENFAIKTGIRPEEATKRNVTNFKRQLKSLGLSFDWDREINTTDPQYYKWTQWIFLQLFKNGLAYQDEMPINWCPSCKIGLANEEVIDHKCERCGEEVVQKNQKQWMLKITDYADRLIEDLDKVDYLEKIKKQQKEWIGRSEGTEIEFLVKGLDKKINVFTTRPDTIFGVTALVLAPGHKLVDQVITKEQAEKVKNYIRESKRKSEFERTKLDKEKTGVFTGSYCFNPVNDKKVPIWIGDYVVASYGGGAVMVVPAHDQRDYEFAKEYGIEIKEVIHGKNSDLNEEAYTESGKLVNSGDFNGLDSEEAKEKITKFLKDKGVAKKSVKYKLRDWVFSRQHYWGEPIPVVHCKKCGIVPLSENDLPLKLPYVEKYEPTDSGESPLANIDDWVNTQCPKCGGVAQRETDTMPNWAGSNWYYLRYCDPHNDKEIASKENMEYWMPVDWYNGGMEHTTLHLLYSRFIYKALFDFGIVPQSEPYKKRTAHGMILAEDGRKMSKSLGNVINPDDIVDEFGADTLRVYEMFMGPFDQAIGWSQDGVKGVRKFLSRVYHLVQETSKKDSSEEALKEIHRLNKRVEEDIKEMKFNTAISGFMEFINFAYKNKESIGQDILERFLLLLAPFAPHITEELWHDLGKEKSIHIQDWPEHNSKLIKKEEFVLLVQINGKLRDKFKVRTGISKEEAKELALKRDKIKGKIKGKNIRKIIYVENRLINLVI
jgi:leucyl-tRNA synthetase